MLDFTPDCVEMLEQVRLVSSRGMICEKMRTWCIRSLTCKPHEENHINGSQLQGEI